MKLKHIIEPVAELKARFREEDKEGFFNRSIIAFGLTENGEAVPLCVDKSGEIIDPREKENFAAISGESVGEKMEPKMEPTRDW